MADPSLRRRARTFVTGGLVLALVAAVGGLLLSGDAGPTALFDPGPLVRWGLPAVTVGVDVAATVTIGAFALCALVLRRPAPVGTAPSRAARAPQPAAAGTEHQPDGTAWRQAALVGTVAAVAWAILQAGQLLLTHASITGSGIGGEQYGAQLFQFLTEIELGRTLAWSVVLSAVVAVAAVAVAGYTSAAWAAVVAVVALVPTAMTGHSAGATGHELAVSSLWMHLVGVCLWLGGLVVLLLVAHRTGPLLPDAVDRYSRMALWSFVLVAVSGAANAWLRLGAPTELVTTPYGVLLLTKILLFVAL
ncbi:CopD family protein, partial [Georgenia sp. 10Sc9-8]|nr:CopD family protein [Georgenia halotolerans]